MDSAARQAAKTLIQNIKKFYTYSSYTYVPVNEKEFPHLDLQAYKRVRIEFESRGFKFLSDFEVLEISNASNTLLARTIIRSFVSNDGPIAAFYYQARPRMSRLLKILLVGILNFRWTAVTQFFLNALQTRHCIDLESELEDGKFIVTSNSQAASTITNPPTIESKFYPYGTSLNVLLEHHQKQLAAYGAQNPPVHPIRITSLENLLQMSERQREVKNAYRATVGWVTHQELQKMTSSTHLQSPPETNTPYNISRTAWDKLSKENLFADAIFKEVQQLLREEKEHSINKQ